MAAAKPASAHALAISPLFVPADRPERIGKALASAADLVIVDLEDAVAAESKDTARATLAEYLHTHPDMLLAVRVNAADTSHHAADLALCRSREQIQIVMLPKAESAEHIQNMNIEHAAIWPLIETPRGALNAEAIASAAGVGRLAFGALDLASATDVDAAHEAGRGVLDQARARLVMASAVAGIAPPLDSPHPAVREPERAGQAAERAVAMGFGGMLAIHPAQLDPIRRAFMPNQADCDWAERVVEAAAEHTGAIQLDGQMIDAPVVARARRLLARARHLAGD